MWPGACAQPMRIFTGSSADADLGADADPLSASKRQLTAAAIRPMMLSHDCNVTPPTRRPAVNYRLISKLYQRQRGAQRGKSVPNGRPSQPGLVFTIIQDLRRNCGRYWRRT